MDEIPSSCYSCSNISHRGGGQDITREFSATNRAESLDGIAGGLNQANIAQAGNLSGYSLSKSQMYFSLQAELKVEPLMTTLPFFSYDEYSNDLDTKTDWCTYKINITRGY